MPSRELKGARNVAGDQSDDETWRRTIGINVEIDVARILQVLALFVIAWLCGVESVHPLSEEGRVTHTVRENSERRTGEVSFRAGTENPRFLESRWRRRPSDRTASNNAE
jgi:hypothetical protein